jgi:hypothetical protein
MKSNLYEFLESCMEYLNKQQSGTSNPPNLFPEKNKKCCENTINEKEK